MSAALLFDSITRIARHEAAARPVVCAGTVSNIFPNDGTTPDHAVSVKLRKVGAGAAASPRRSRSDGFRCNPRSG